MRLWTLHPKYLDSKGLVSAWREGLLAKKVLEDKTVGYRNHPQLERFKECRIPIVAINAYLECLLAESLSRGYKFDKGKIAVGSTRVRALIATTKGQVDYEWKLLLHKLKARNLKAYESMRKTAEVEVNDIFKIIEGPVASWEKIKNIAVAMEE